MQIIGIVGSINIDLVVQTERRPQVGETVFGTSFDIKHGGKGANIAVAAARLGGRAAMFGAVGDDVFAEDAIKNLRNNKVDTSGVIHTRGTATGVAVITLSGGDNSIIVASGANKKTDAKYLQSMEKKLEKCSIIGTQLEIDAGVALALSELCRRKGIKFVFNPSPIVEYDSKIFENAHIVIVNEIEVKRLRGYNEKLKDGAAELLAEYPNKLILTEGSRGVRFCDGTQIVHVPSVSKEVVDTTGAGDTFMGALMVQLSEGAGVFDAVKFANAAAGLKVAKLGAQTGMPYRHEVNV